MTSPTPAMVSTEAAHAVGERYATAWLANDLEGILGCYSAGFTLHYFGNNAFSGDHIGRQASLDVLLETGRRAPRELLAVDEILSGPGAAVLVVRELLDVDGERCEVRRVLRFRIVGDLFAECWLYDEHQALIDRAWVDPG